LRAWSTVPSGNTRPALRETRVAMWQVPDAKRAHRCDREAMTNQERSVLVGIDGTPSGREALSLGTALAVLTGSTLVLGSVYGHASGKFGGLTWPSRHDADGWLAEADTNLVGRGLNWRSFTIPADSVAEGLIELAELESVDAIVLGSSRHGRVGRVLAGSTVRRVVHGAPCAVAVAPHQWEELPSDAPVAIGVAFTDSPEARGALAAAAELATAAHASLHVLSVVSDPSAAHPMFAASGVSHATWIEDRRRAAEQAAQDAVAAVTPDVVTEITLLEGDPVERLAEASHQVDLLVLGSRRYGPVRTTLLGGVSSPLIDRAACPLVIVPRGVPGHTGEPAPSRAATHA
jgi:nucleotide-binding universal stress UspA family protein